MDRIAGANVVGLMDHRLRGQKGNIFTYFFTFHAFITIGMGDIFLITNRVNTQIILQTKV